MTRPRTHLDDDSLAQELLRALEDWTKTRGDYDSSKILTETTAHAYTRACDRLQAVYGRFRRGGSPALTLRPSLERALERSVANAKR